MGLGEFTFSTQKPEVALADPELIALHAACVKVSHMSAIRDFLDELAHEKEVAPILAYNGGSAALLHNLPLAVV